MCSLVYIAFTETFPNNTLVVSHSFVNTLQALLSLMYWNHISSWLCIASKHRVGCFLLHATCDEILPYFLNFSLLNLTPSVSKYYMINLILVFIHLFQTELGLPFKIDVFEIGLAILKCIASTIRQTYTGNITYLLKLDYMMCLKIKF